METEKPVGAGVNLPGGRPIKPFFFRLWQRLRITIWDETYESAFEYAKSKWGDNNIEPWEDKKEE